MPRGGSRPGSGPKKGTKYKPRVKHDIPQESAESDVIKNGLPPPLPSDPIFPLDYMLRVLNDPNASEDRKEKMAQLAAPYCHARKDQNGGKRENQQESAKKAVAGKFQPGAPPAKVVNISSGGK